MAENLRVNIESLKTPLSPSPSETSSIFKRATSTRPEDFISGDSPEIFVRRNEITLKRRVVFKWLPLGFSNDLVYGSWWFFYGSLLTIIIPIFPLIALYEDLWDNHHVEELGIPNVEHAVAYSLLVLIGILYTVGSYAFVRAVESPPPKPLFTNYHVATDELFGMWCFFWGTVPSIPLLAIYVYFNQGSALFMVAFVMCVVFTFITLVAVFACYPGNEEEHHTLCIYVLCPCLRRKEYLAPILLACLPKNSSLRRHVSNDWLVVSWGLFLGCLFSTAICIALLYYAVQDGEGRLIFDYSTGFVDMLLFTIGSMYFLAGSYPSPESDDNTQGSTSLAHENPL